MKAAHPSSHVIFLSQPVAEMDGLFRVEVIREGEWKYPSLPTGGFKITRPDLDTLKLHFDKGTKGYTLPVNEEHNEKDVVGWLRKVEIAPNSENSDSLWGWFSVENAERHHKVEAGEIKFASAEINLAWSDPEDGGKTKKVLEGLALTNKPYVKRMDSIKKEPGRVMAVNLSEAKAHAGKGVSMGVPVPTGPAASPAPAVATPEPWQERQDLHEESFSYDLADFDQRGVAMTSRLRDEFFANPKKRQRWDVVPAARLSKIWNEYANSGLVHDEKGLDDIAYRMIENTLKLASNTELAGHTPANGIQSWAEEMEYDWTDEHDSDFDSYLTDPVTGQWRLSDYAMDDLYEDARALDSATDPVKKLQIIDRMLNRVHRRSDVAGLYVEGGSDTLSALSRSGTRLSEGPTVAASEPTWRPLEGHRHKGRLQWRYWPPGNRSGAATIEVATDLGDGVGELRGFERDGSFNISGSDLFETFRGKGVGRAMYEALVQTAQERGLSGVVSDATVSPEARRVYDRLRELGYGVETLDREGNGYGGVMRPGEMDYDIEDAGGYHEGDDGEGVYDEGDTPLFRITPKKSDKQVGLSEADDAFDAPYRLRELPKTVDRDAPATPETYESLTKLPYGHDLYFQPDDRAEVLPLGAIDPADRERMRGIVNANVRMVRPGPERGPVLVVRNGDRYRVVEGNSTFLNARHSGWPDIPAIVFDSEDEALAFDDERKRVAHLAEPTEKQGYVDPYPVLKKRLRKFITPNEFDSLWHSESRDALVKAVYGLYREHAWDLVDSPRTSLGSIETLEHLADILESHKGPVRSEDGSAEFGYDMDSWRPKRVKMSEGEPVGDGPPPKRWEWAEEVYEGMFDEPLYHGTRDLEGVLRDGLRALQPASELRSDDGVFAYRREPGVRYRDGDEPIEWRPYLQQWWRDIGKEGRRKVAAQLGRARVPRHVDEIAGDVGLVFGIQDRTIAQDYGDVFQLDPADSDALGWFAADEAGKGEYVFVLPVNGRMGTKAAVELDEDAAVQLAGGGGLQKIHKVEPVPDLSIEFVEDSANPGADQEVYLDVAEAMDESATSWGTQGAAIAEGAIKAGLSVEDAQRLLEETALMEGTLGDLMARLCSELHDAQDMDPVLAKKAILKHAGFDSSVSSGDTALLSEGRRWTVAHEGVVYRPTSAAQRNHAQVLRMVPVRLAEPSEKMVSSDPPWWRDKGMHSKITAIAEADPRAVPDVVPYAYGWLLPSGRFLPNTRHEIHYYTVRDALERAGFYREAEGYNDSYNAAHQAGWVRVAEDGSVNIAGDVDYTPEQIGWLEKHFDQNPGGRGYPQQLWEASWADEGGVRRFKSGTSVEDMKRFLSVPIGSRTNWGRSKVAAFLVEGAVAERPSALDPAFLEKVTRAAMEIARKQKRRMTDSHFYGWVLPGGEFLANEGAEIHSDAVEKAMQQAGGWDDSGYVDPYDVGKEAGWLRVDHDDTRENWANVANFRKIPTPRQMEWLRRNAPQAQWEHDDGKSRFKEGSGISQLEGYLANPDWKPSKITAFLTEWRGPFLDASAADTYAQAMTDYAERREDLLDVSPSELREPAWLLPSGRVMPTGGHHLDEARGVFERALPGQSHAGIAESEMYELAHRAGWVRVNSTGQVAFRRSPTPKQVEWITKFLDNSQDPLWETRDESGEWMDGEDSKSMLNYLSVGPGQMYRKSPLLAFLGENNPMVDDATFNAKVKRDEAGKFAVSAGSDAPRLGNYGLAISRPPGDPDQMAIVENPMLEHIVPDGYSVYEIEEGFLHPEDVDRLHKWGVSGEQGPVGKPVYPIPASFYDTFGAQNAVQSVSRQRFERVVDAVHRAAVRYAKRDDSLKVFFGATGIPVSPEAGAELARNRDPRVGAYMKLIDGNPALVPILKRFIDFKDAARFRLSDLFGAHLRGMLRDIPIPPPVPLEPAGPDVAPPPSGAPWSPDYEQISADDARAIWATVKGEQKKADGGLLTVANFEDARRRLLTIANAKPELLKVIGVSRSKAIETLAETSPDDLGRLKPLMAFQSAVNKDVPEAFRWVGVSNIGALESTRWNGLDLAAHVKEFTIEGGAMPDGDPKWEAMIKRDVGTAMLAYDSGLDYSGLKVAIHKFTGDESMVRGQYDYRYHALFLRYDGTLPTVSHELAHSIDSMWSQEFVAKGVEGYEQQPEIEPFYRGLSSMGDALRMGWIKPGLAPEKVRWGLAFAEFVEGLQDRAEPGSAYAQSPWEVFARFGAWFVERVSAGAPDVYARRDRLTREQRFDDGFKQADAERFVKLLQWKAYVDAKYPAQDARVAVAGAR